MESDNPITPHVINLHYTEPIVRRAVWCFWSRAIGLKGPILLVLAVGMIVYLVATGDRSWFVGMFGALIVMALMMAAAVYVVHYRNSIGKLRRMKEPVATLEITPERIKVASDSGMGELGWNAVEELWTFSDVWLLLLSRAQFITVPVADLTPVEQEALADHVRAAGGRVR